ncbi:MAG TPA: ROK family transcriptional regulator [Angustibacter sp.]|nr:ROK family transcriptional regulator [Angustibacter sp.]
MPTDRAVVGSVVGSVAGSVAGSVVAPATTDRLRRDNAARVLRSLRDDGPASRAQLAQRTGLAKATVGAIVTDLVSAGAVRDDDPVADVGRTGRPGRPVSLDGSDVVGLGLEVNVDYVAATALDLAGRPRLSTQVPLPPSDADAAGLALQRLARDSLAALEADGRRVLGVTVAVPGLVDRTTGTVVGAPNLHWRERDVASDLRTILGPRPVWVDNDANCAASGEASFGVARGVDHVLYLTGTVGIGAGLVVDGRVERGAHGLAGEVGHAPLGDSSRPCACGRTGCWETAVGLEALVRESGVELPAGSALDPVSVASMVVEQCASDPLVASGVDRLCRSLATGLSVLALTLDPSLIVLGGFFVPLGDRLLPVVRERLSGASRTDVALSTLGLHAASTGAAADVLGQVFTGALALT